MFTRVPPLTSYIELNYFNVYKKIQYLKDFSFTQRNIFFVTANPTKHKKKLIT